MVAAQVKKKGNKFQILRMQILVTVTKLCILKKITTYFVECLSIDAKPELKLKWHCHGFGQQLSFSFNVCKTFLIINQNLSVNRCVISVIQSS